MTTMMLKSGGSAMNMKLLGEQRSFGWADVDIREDDLQYAFTFDIPPLFRDNISIWAKEKILTVSAQRPDRHVNAGGGGSLTKEAKNLIRSFRLPVKVDPKRVRAGFVEESLVVILPKRDVLHPNEDFRIN